MRRFLRRRRRRPSRTVLAVKQEPKMHKVKPDQWTPPFNVVKESSIKGSQLDLATINPGKVFDLGRVRASGDIMRLSEMDTAFKKFVDNCLERFQNLDWGDSMNEVDCRVNDSIVAAQTGVVLGIYADPRTGIRIWIITDLDQGSTLICFPGGNQSVKGF